VTPTQPTILDAQGTPLSEGMRVNHDDGSGPGQFWGLAEHPNGEQTARVRWGGCSLLSWELTEVIGPTTFRTPDLKAVLTPDPERAVDAS
jgi:hypothetical protein